jgi:hypothetical protein
MLTAAATKTKPIGDDDDRRFTIIVNSASTVAPIGLPPKMAKFCHTSNRSLLVRQCRRALLRLYFNSSATGRRSVVGGVCPSWKNQPYYYISLHGHRSQCLGSSYAKLLEHTLRCKKHTFKMYSCVCRHQCMKKDF